MAYITAPDTFCIPLISSGLEGNFIYSSVGAAKQDEYLNETLFVFGVIKAVTFFLENKASRI